MHKVRTHEEESNINSKYSIYKCIYFCILLEHCKHDICVGMYFPFVIFLCLCLQWRRGLQTRTDPHTTNQPPRSSLPANRAAARPSKSQWASAPLGGSLESQKLSQSETSCLSFFLWTVLLREVKVCGGDSQVTSSQTTVSWVLSDTPLSNQRVDGRGLSLFRFRVSSAYYDVIVITTNIHVYLIHLPTYFTLIYFCNLFFIVFFLKNISLLLLLF